MFQWTQVHLVIKPCEDEKKKVTTYMKEFRLQENSYATPVFHCPLSAKHGVCTPQFCCLRSTDRTRVWYWVVIYLFVYLFTVCLTTLPVPFPPEGGVGLVLDPSVDAYLR
jgi:hypothetical protein